MQPHLRFNVWYAVLAVVAVLVIRNVLVEVGQIESLAYSEFKQELARGNVRSVQVGDTRLSGELIQPLPDGRSRFVTLRVEPELDAELARANVRYERVIESTFFRDVLSWIMPMLVLVALWSFLIKRMAEKGGLGGLGGLGGGFLSVGKSKAKIYMEQDTSVRFADVAGVDEAKEELQEVVAFLKDPGSYGRLGAHIPKGILLVGPPGTGKTLLARAVAGEAKVPFLSISGSEFVEMFVGVGAARVRDLFEQARKLAPAIIFIDELDALGRARGSYGLGGHDEKEQTLNQLLVELDGFDPTVGVVLLAATNRPEILDPALLRAGRFDRQVLLDRPDRRGRIQILQVHLKKVRLAADVNVEQIAALTPGFSGADLANLVNEAALLATRRGAGAITQEDFTRAEERIVAGLEKKNRVLNELERRTIAFHEMGHALVALSIPGSDVVHKISIIPRGIGALGYTIQRPTEDRYLMKRDELENKMAVLLGGRAAEAVEFGEFSTGAADDLAKATDIARSMAMRYGMVEALGQVVFERDRPLMVAPGAPLELGPREYSEATAREIDCAVRDLVGRAFERARSIIESRRGELQLWAKHLLERETLSADELSALRQPVSGSGQRAAA